MQVRSSRDVFEASIDRSIDVLASRRILRLSMSSCQNEAFSSLYGPTRARRSELYNVKFYFLPNKTKKKNGVRKIQDIALMLAQKN